MTNRIGNYFYTGITLSGKTTKALEDLRIDAVATGWPTLILDLMPAKLFMRLPHEKTVDDVLRKLYSSKPGEASGAVFTPKNLKRDFDPIMRALVANGRVHTLLDEMRWVGSRTSIREAFTQAMRAWAQAGGFGLTFRCTTQRPGDLHNDVLAVDPRVYAFRTKGELDLERMQKEFGFDPDILKQLPQGEYCTSASGWES